MEIWVLITIAAAFTQNIRSSLQKHLRGQMGTAGATFVRFGFGVPFALLFLAISLGATGSALPALNLQFAVWLVVAAVSQILAQVLLIILFTRRNFAVGNAYVRMEPVMAAAFGAALLAEWPDAVLILAVAISVVGVLLISIGRTDLTWRSLATGITQADARIGLASAAIFGLAAVGYRGASLALGGPNFLVQGGVTLCCAIFLQSLIMAVWIAFKDPAEFSRLRATWKIGLAVGFVGALASFGWFTAMTLVPAAAVKAVAQVEMLFAYVTTRAVFREEITGREIAGCTLIVAGVLFLVLFG